LEERGEGVKEREAFMLAVWLHDIGKLGVPGEVLDKTGRMPPQELRSYMQYMACIRAEKRMHWANSNQNGAEGKYLPQQRETQRLLGAINWRPKLTEYQRMELEKLKDCQYRDWEYKLKPWFTERQYRYLSVKEGIYTPEERAAYEGHAAETAKLLERLRLLPEYEKAAEWAADHHERLDGSGYPLHLKGEEIARETRILSILDVYETLTGRNTRSYPAQTPERAMGELWREAESGKLDKRLTAQFIEAVKGGLSFPHRQVEN